MKIYNFLKLTIFILIFSNLDNLNASQLYPLPVNTQTDQNAQLRTELNNSGLLNHRGIAGKNMEQIKKNINMKIDDQGTTLLMAAANRQNANLVNLLLTLNANVNQKNNNGLTALDYAKGKPNSSIFEALQKKLGSLQDFDFQSAWLLPTFHSQNTKYVLLGQEMTGIDAMNWNAFGGSRGSTTNVIQQYYGPAIVTTQAENVNKTIARNFAQQTEELMGKESDILGQININNPSTQDAIANKNNKSVIFTVDFNSDAIENLIKNFTYFARKHQYVQALAKVKWADLMNAIKNGSRNVAANVAVVDRNNSAGYSYKNQNINLSSNLVATLKPFANDVVNKKNTYTRGANPKIRFY